MSIPVNQHKQAITQRIIATFSDDKEPRMGFSGFFPSITTLDKYVSIEVERNRQLIAVDVQRGTDANMNTFSNYSDKIYYPPMYKEGFDYTSLESYDVSFGQNNAPTQSQAFNMINEATRRLNQIRNMVKRAIAKQQAQVLQTGIVTVKNGDNIDFKRKAASLKVLTGTDVWSNAASDPYKDIETGCLFLRDEGKAASNQVNVVMGRDAFREFLNNQKVQDGAEIRRITRTSLGMPQFENSTGMTFHGQVAVLDFVVNIWTYTETYEEDNGTHTPYLDNNKVVFLSEDFQGNTAYAGVPAIIYDQGNVEFPQYISRVQAEFYVNNYVDPKRMAHIFELASAPLVVPVSIDRVYTLTAVA